MLGILASHLRLNRRSQRWHALGVCHQCIFREARGHLDATVVGQTGLDGEACLPHLRTSRAERVFVPNNCSKVSRPSLGQSTACLADRRRAPRRLTACLSLPRLCQIAGELQDEERESARSRLVPACFSWVLPARCAALIWSGRSRASSVHP
jgi:hypothetical protein